MSGSVLAARFPRRSDLVPVVRAALVVDIAYVALDRQPLPGKQVLQLWVGDDLVAAVLAEPVGTGRGGEYPLRLRLLDPAHEPELRAIAEGRPPEVPQVEVPPVSEAQAEDRTLQSKGAPIAGAVAASKQRPKPVELVGAIPTPSVPTTVFDPEALLRAREQRANNDDSLTIPRATVGGVDPEMPIDEDGNTLQGTGERRGKLVSWNVRTAPATPDAMAGRTISDGKYSLESVIGTGSIGIVYKASHCDLGRTVAIKILNPRYRDEPELLRVFRSEARAASQLEHPNVARVYDYGQEPDGLVYIVMEYLSGYALRSVMGKRKRLAPARAVDIMMQVCAALSAAHDRGIVHRDVKPDNIVIVPTQDDEGDPTEIVKVCDFGIAAIGTGNPEDKAVGTPEYIAPEQTVGGAVSPSADVYACGVVLYEMLTGEVPFTAPEAYRIFLMHQKEPPRPPTELVPGLPRALEAVVLRALAKSPEARFQNARELRAELRKLSL